MGRDLEYSGRLGHRMSFVFVHPSNDFLKTVFFSQLHIALFSYFERKREKVLCSGASFNEAQNSPAE